MRRCVPDAAAITAAVDALRAGEVIAYPTETVYGLGADPFNEQALDRLFAVKGRDARQAVLLIVAKETQLQELVAAVSPRARVLMEKFWPGPLSLLFEPKPGLHASLLGPGGKVCVRCSSHALAQDLCQGFGHAITSTSANRSGEAPAIRGDAIALEGVALVLDGGTLAPSAPSTVYDPEQGLVLREGAISAAAIQAALI